MDQDRLAPDFSQWAFPDALLSELGERVALSIYRTDRVLLVRLGLARISKYLVPDLSRCVARK